MAPCRHRVVKARSWVFLLVVAVLQFSPADVSGWVGDRGLWRIQIRNRATPDSALAIGVGTSYRRWKRPAPGYSRGPTSQNHRSWPWRALVVFSFRQQRQ